MGTKDETEIEADKRRDELAKRVLKMPPQPRKPKQGEPSDGPKQPKGRPVRLGANSEPMVAAVISEGQTERIANGYNLLPGWGSLPWITEREGETCGQKVHVQNPALKKEAAKNEVVGTAVSSQGRRNDIRFDLAPNAGEK